MNSGYQLHKKKERQFWIDVLRGVAILLVLYVHLDFIRGHVLYENSLQWALNHAGWMGVDLFFVISGLLIGGLVFREIQERNSLDMKRFYMRRAFRIFPVYYFLYFLIYIAPESRGVPDSDFVTGLFFIQNYLYPLKHFNFTHSWSLCVEEQFYLTFPVLCWVLIRIRKFHFFPYLMLSTIPIALLLRTYHKLSTDKIDFIFYSHSRMEGIALGCLLAYLFFFHKEIIEKLSNHKKKILGAGFILLIPGWSLHLFQSFFMGTVGISMTALAFFCFVFVAATSSPGRWARIMLAPIAILGTFSYTLYLVHPLIYKLSLFKIFSLPLHAPIVKFFSSYFSYNTSQEISYILISLFFALILSVCIEKPFLYIRNKIFKSPVPESRVSGGNKDSSVTQ